MAPTKAPKRAHAVHALFQTVAFKAIDLDAGEASRAGAHIGVRFTLMNKPDGMDIVFEIDVDPAVMRFDSAMTS
jgi:hypothetical protein